MLEVPLEENVSLILVIPHGNHLRTYSKYKKKGQMKKKKTKKQRDGEEKGWEEENNTDTKGNRKKHIAMEMHVYW